MKKWLSLRLGILGLVALAVVGVWGRSLSISLESPAPEAFVFPPQPASWQWVDSGPYRLPEAENAELPAFRYRYRREDLDITATVVYVVHPHVNEKYFRTYSPILANTEIRDDGAGGFYGVVEGEDALTLHGCIRPRGGSVITYSQFSQSPDTIDLSPSHVWKWLRGQTPLRDYRCLWASLQIPAGDEAVLDALWGEWRSPWPAHFPKP